MLKGPFGEFERPTSKLPIELPLACIQNVSSASSYILDKSIGGVMIVAVSNKLGPPPPQVLDS